MIQLMLNARKPYNYAFFCPESRLHLTVGNPIGFVDRITSAIIRGLRSDVLVDVDHVIDINTGKLITDNKTEDKKEQVIPSPEPVVEQPIVIEEKPTASNNVLDDIIFDNNVEPSQEEQKPKRGRKQK